MRGNESYIILDKSRFRQIFFWIGKHLSKTKPKTCMKEEGRNDIISNLVIKNNIVFEMSFCI